MFYASQPLRLDLNRFTSNQPLRLYHGDIAMRNLVFYAHVNHCGLRPCQPLRLYQGDIAMCTWYLRPVNHYGYIRAILQCETLVFYSYVNHYGCIRAILQCVTWCCTSNQHYGLYQGDIAMRNLVFLLLCQPLRLYQGDIAMRNLVFYSYVNHYGYIRAILQCVTWCFTPMSTITAISGRYCNA